MSDDLFLAICVAVAIGLYVTFVLLWIRADRQYDEQSGRHLDGAS